MNSYERLYNILIENQVPAGDPPLPSVFDNPEEEEMYRGRKRQGRKPRKRLRSKRTQAAYDRAKKREAQQSSDEFSRGTVSQQRGK